MVLIELKKTFEKRRTNLIALLEKPDNELDLGKQHQVYGAIKEIENFLRTLDHLRDLELQDTVNFKLRNETTPGFMDKMTMRFKKF